MDCEGIVVYSHYRSIPIPSTSFPSWPHRLQWHIYITPKELSLNKYSKGRGEGMVCPHTDRFPLRSIPNIVSALYHLAESGLYPSPSILTSIA